MVIGSEVHFFRFFCPVAESLCYESLYLFSKIQVLKTNK